MPRFAPPRLPGSVLEHGHSGLQPAGRASGWTGFVAGLWSRPKLGLAASLGRSMRRGALVLTLVLSPGCSELAQPSEAGLPPSPPAYVPIVANYLQSAFKDRGAFDGYEISGVRWVHAIRGWSWLACVHFQDHGHHRTYALFIQDNTVIDGRYAVETDACEAQTFTQFDVVTGVLGRPTAPVQPALY